MYKTKIISEIGLSHMGSLDLAINYIDKSKKAGVDYVKFQTHIAEAESTYNEKFRIKFSKKFKSRFDYWKSLEFSIEEWRTIKKYCHQKKIGFFSSPFSIEAVKILSKINNKIWKISSGEFFNTPLINEIVKKKGEIIISTGMSNYNEIKNKVKFLKKSKKKFTIMICHSEYPSALEKTNLKLAEQIKFKLKCKVGLSDHSGKIYPGLLAIAKKFDYLEIHCCDTKDDFGPDVSSSLTFEEIKFLCECRDNFDIIDNSLIKNKLNNKIIKMRKLFTKSWALKKNMRKGEIIKKTDLVLKKPGSGFKEKDIKILIGKKLTKDLSNKYLISKFDIK